MSYNTKFSKDDIGINYPGIKPGDLPLISGIQKSSINTADSFCLNPYGAVSNLNCPDWDPACNCWVTQYMPGIPEPSDIELQKLKNSTSECELIKKHLNKNISNPTGEGSWLGLDYTNPNSLYNCPACDPNKTSPTSVRNPAQIEYFKIKANQKTKLQGLTGVFPYSTGIPFNKGITTTQEWDKNGFGWADSIEYTDWKCTGGCFPYYMEYSKTNATFWKTPIKTPLLRKGQIGSYNAQKIKILVNGDTRIKAGSVINLDIPIGQETNAVTQKRFSGRWLVYRVERVISTFKHSMFLYLMRDGFPIKSNVTPSLGKVAFKSSVSGSGDLGGS
jgi:hypothetical protein